MFRNYERSDLERTIKRLEERIVYLEEEREKAFKEVNQHQISLNNTLRYHFLTTRLLKLLASLDNRYTQLPRKHFSGKTLETTYSKMCLYPQKLAPHDKNEINSDKTLETELAFGNRERWDSFTDKLPSSLKLFP